MSLRTRVLAGSILIGVLLSLAAFVVVQSTAASLSAQLDQQLENAREPLNVGMSGFPYPDDADDAGGGGYGDQTYELVDRPRLSSLYVVLCRPDGTLAEVALPDLGYGDLPDLDVDQVWRAAETQTPYTVDAGEVRYRVLAYPEPGTDDIVILALPMWSVDATVARVRAVALITTAAILTVLALVAWWVIRLGIRPIKQMTATASAIAGGDLTHRVPEAPAKTEAGDLGRSLNLMLSSIETAFEARRPVDLTRLAADAATDAAVRDPGREITGPGSAEPVFVLGDGDRRRQVVTNLVGNALVHTPTRAPVEVSVTQESGRGVLRVADHGGGMPAEVAARAFERFYRADPARSRQRGGSGLGLSIVESIVAASGGTVTLHTQPARG